MALLEDLYNQATGLLSSIETGGQSVGQKLGTKNLFQKQQDQSIVSPDDMFPGGLPDAVPGGTTLPSQRKPVFTPVTTPSNQITPPKKPNDISEIAKNPGLFQRVFGMDTKTFAKNWQDKGGYEGLMANPAFLLGLGIIQSSAQGKPIGSDIFDVAVKSGAISAQYADRLKERQGLLAPINDAQRDSMRAVLEEQGITKPGWLDKLKNLFGNENADAKYREALDMIYNRAEELAKAESKRIGKKVRFDPRKYAKDAVKQLQDENKLTVREDGLIISGTVQAKTKKIKGNREHGGPVESGEAYIVGEKGAEMFIPETDGNIIDNDDSKVVNMLLESNPQLKNVSRARAVKILKARFPDYF